MKVYSRKSTPFVTSRLSCNLLLFSRITKAKERKKNSPNGDKISFFTLTISGSSNMCFDARSDCDTTLTSIPDMCTQYPEYAWHNCRLTCRIDGTNNKLSVFIKYTSLNSHCVLSKILLFLSVIWKNSDMLEWKGAFYRPLTKYYNRKPN